MGEFPSGQRGQTVNLLLIASVVRIHLPPPNARNPNFFLIGKGFGFLVYMRDISDRPVDNLKTEKLPIDFLSIFRYI